MLLPADRCHLTPAGTRWLGLTLTLALLGYLPGTPRVSAQDSGSEGNRDAASNEVVPDSFDPQLRIERDGIELSLVAEHPQIATPTGIDVDAQGAVWAIANHTHFRPEQYSGPEHDEILVFHPDGKREVFYDKTDASMDLELGAEGWVYIAQRDRVLRLRDTDGDGRGDQQETVAQLTTEADYPHNGLSGLTWSNEGDLVFALGENFAQPWTLTGSDGSSVRGSGEGGIFVCRADGGSLRRLAKGFWNPFGICIREDGNLFAAENDPGSRPPCRLLHVVEGGDYGYQRKYGNASYHPFVCWNGELPGTLPMLDAVGEAPCGIVPLASGLIVTSWTEHRIDYYPLRPHGASFHTERITLVEGGHDFRPTCIAAASETTFYLTDWVVGSYELHGKGRIWRLQVDPAAATDWIGPRSLQAPNSAAQQAASLRQGDDSCSLDELFQLAGSQDPFLRCAAIQTLSQRLEEVAPARRQSLSTEELRALLLATKLASPNDQGAVASFLEHPDPEIQFEAMRWMSEAEMVEFLPRVQQRLKDPSLDFRLFEAALATANTLSGTPELGVSDPKMLMALLENPDTSTRIQAFALRLLDPQHGGFSPKVWRALFQSRDRMLLTELVRSVAILSTPQAHQFLLEVAADRNMPETVRADAVAGLAGANQDALQKLLEIADTPETKLRDEALRSLRFAELDDTARQRLGELSAKYPDASALVAAAVDPGRLSRSRPQATDLASWKQRLSAVAEPVDLDAGRRIFHHASVGTCIKCHRYSGRGSDVGPDLSGISSIGDPDRLLRALLQPSLDVDPQYHPRMLVTADGLVFTGILLRDGGGGSEFYRNQFGREQMFKTDDIVQRKELNTSMMPDGLFELMTDREIRDLLAFVDNNHPAHRLSSTSTSPNWQGSWWLDFEDGYGGWLDLARSGDQWQASLLWRVGSARPMEMESIDGDQLVLVRSNRNNVARYEAEIQGDTISIQLAGTPQRAVGKKCPPIPQRPDLTQVRFGDPIALFNGEDLNGWRLQPTNAKNGWRVAGGELINETPKTDFSAYGEYGNLRTDAVFGDCQLHVEFNVASGGNSGIYVRGLYEAQVVDRDSPMQGINGPGAIFGRIAPAKNAGREGGQWQSYDITLVDRHLTVRLNGQLVIDNEPIVGCTGGALFGNVLKDGPLYLQGDHTSVRYRNLWLRPRIDSE